MEQVWDNTNKITVAFSNLMLRYVRSTYDNDRCALGSRGQDALALLLPRPQAEKEGVVLNMHSERILCHDTAHVNAQHDKITHFTTGNAFEQPRYYCTFES